MISARSTALEVGNDCLFFSRFDLFPEGDRHNMFHFLKDIEIQDVETKDEIQK